MTEASGLVLAGNNFADLYINNDNEAAKLYCNMDKDNNFISIQLRENSSNSQALGPRIYITTVGIEQLRALRNDNNFTSVAALSLSKLPVRQFTRS